MEEICFRGFLYRTFQHSKLGDAGAILITTILWTSIHLPIAPLGIVDLLGAGMILGIMRWKTGSVVPSMIAHCINNSLKGITIVLFLILR